MRLGKSLSPKNPQAIKQARRQIDEVVTKAEDYKDWKFNHQLEFWDKDRVMIFDMDIDPQEEGDVYTFEFWLTRAPDRNFLDQTRGLFDMKNDKSEHGDNWTVTMTSEQFSNPGVLDELLGWLFEEWTEIELEFQSPDDFREFSSDFNVYLPYRFAGDIQNKSGETFSGGRAASTAAAATTTGYFVAYRSEEDFSESDGESSGFEFPEF